MTDSASPFTHSTPELYDRYMVPLLFEPFARHVAERSALMKPNHILETAAGTGVVTQALHRAMPETEIVATDINPGMLEVAAGRATSDRVSFLQADALQLPFADESFDLVVSQFGIMFFPDKVRANQEARRVLRANGNYLLVTFDRLDRNPVPKRAGDTVAAMFPDDPPAYMTKGPFSYVDPELVEHDLRAAGFSNISLETVALTNRVNARQAAQGMVLGSPFRAEIGRRDPGSLESALDAVTAALAEWDGNEAPMSAHVVIATNK
jgi:ubiquinone/menaquinone biosynthesis C-methylase UbiE